jgi:hypothetical protein
MPFRLRADPCVDGLLRDAVVFSSGGNTHAFVFNAVDNLLAHLGRDFVFLHIEDDTSE